MPDLSPIRAATGVNDLMETCVYNTVLAAECSIQYEALREAVRNRDY